MQQPLIAGFATPVGGAITILRISGEGAQDTLNRVFVRRSGKAIVPRRLYCGTARDENGAIDEAMAVFFPAPHSYTAEDVAELHLHGSPAVAERVLQAVLSAGARPAEPGEFTKRAFLNGRIDLMQAEAVMSLIRADSDRAAGNALEQLQGKLSSRIEALQKAVEGAIAAIEAMLDYPEEVPEDTSRQAQENLSAISAELDELLASAAHGIKLRDGALVVLCGRPNAGKSTLMNALLGQDRAIVTAQPGTTRDTLEETLQLDGLRIRLCDTAGIHETNEEAEAFGVERARAMIRKSDLALFLVDRSQPLTQEDRDLATELSGRDVLLLANKTDADAVVSEKEIRSLLPDAPYLELSALHGHGIEAVLDFLRKLIPPREDMCITVARQQDALRRAREHIGTALEAAELLPPDFIVLDARLAWQALGELTGQTLDEAIIDRIFADFCLGK